MAARHKIHCCSIVIATALLLLVGTGAEAQRGGRAGGGGADGELTPPAFGARVGWDWDESNWSVGGQVRLMLPFLPGLEFLPSGDVFFLEDQKQWQVNLDAAVQLFPIIYAGGGFAMARDSLPTSSGPTVESGYNVFAGLNSPAIGFPIVPFAEARWTVINRFVRPFRMIAGVNVSLGGRRDRRR